MTLDKLLDRIKEELKDKKVKVQVKKSGENKLEIKKIDENYNITFYYKSKDNEPPEPYGQ